MRITTPKINAERITVGLIDPHTIKIAAQPFHNQAAINERPRPDTISGYSRIAHNLKLFISTSAISIGVALLFIAAAADMTVSTGLVAELCVLGLLSAFGGMAGLKWEGVLDR